MTEQFQLYTLCLSSLAKVLPDREPQEQQLHAATALSNEIVSFQVAYRANSGSKPQRNIEIRVQSEISDRIKVRKVGLVPAELPCYSDHDEHIISAAPGLYPDPLLPLTGLDDVITYAEQWRSIWLTVDLGGAVKAGQYPIRVQFVMPNGEVCGEELFELEVIAAELPPQKLIHTEWFHSDCLAVYYGVDVFSEAHWKLIEQYLETAVRHGVNMILTPLFTPPLDTEIGGERPTVQLVDVERSGSAYTFGFDRLKRWIRLCEEKGIRYFEFSHLFTQWGAYHAPKIMAAVDGVEERVFGWDTDAGGAEYRSFLDQFLPVLVTFVVENGLEQRSYFHVSDEPRLAHIDSYKNAKEIIYSHLSQFPVIDALSRYEFYEQGLVKNPIPASNHIEPFLEGGVPDLWTYYCCSQYKEVSNRFIGMPSARNRILGLQLYKFNIAGFLHWGFNFWFSRLSARPIDPYKVTDAVAAFPAGDPFVVYPGEDGPVESLRLEVFYEALQDLRALQLLESYIGREEVIKLMDGGLEQEITFSVYPREASWLLAFREKVNALIKENSK
jgi:hypothetical protein